MIAKGNQRSGGYQLATHLLNAHDNERVEVMEVRGAVANDLHGAFTEWHAQSKATKCTKYLYSLSVNPDQKQGHLTREQYLDFLGRVEKQLGLENRGRAVVFHWKKDQTGEAREHCHAVWSRVDAHAGRAVNIAHDRMKLRSVAQEFALEHARVLPAGMQKERGTERHAKRAGHSSLAEKQQEERSGIAKDERRAVLTKAWATSADGPGFVSRLQEAGYVLAQGDKRSYVVIDRAGEVHSLSRQLEGVKTAALKDRLKLSHAPDTLPTVEAAQQRIAAQREKLRAVPPPSARTIADDRRAQLAARQDSRWQDLQAQRKAMTERHAVEKRALEAAGERMPFNRVAPRGISRLVRHIANRYQRHQQSRVLERRHKNERQELYRQERKCKSLDAREKRSLEIRIGREEFQRLAKQIKRRDAVLERLGIDSLPSQLPRESVLPAMSADERRPRLQTAFHKDGMAAGPQLTREQRAEQLLDGVRKDFKDVTQPLSANSDSTASEIERLREQERLRQLEALRHER